MTGDWRLTIRAAALLVAAFTAAPAGASLTAAPRLAAAYDTILAAKFDQVPAQLARTCPPAPRPACQALEAVSVWWQIQLNPESHALDARLNDLAQTAIAASE